MSSSSGSERDFVRIEGLGKSYGGVAAVAGVDLSIGRGEFFSLLGPSGCGKTTLLRLIGGFETADTGRILIDGVDVSALPPYLRPVNTVFQSYALFPHMTVRANIEFGLKRERMPSSRRRQRVDEMLELVDMADLGERRPHALSGGQRQRVALARALAKLPKVLLLDEPLAALDRRLRESTRLELVEIQRRIGITFLLVTHDQEEALTLSNRLAVMRGGRIAQVGGPRDIYDRPGSRFVATFLGQTNLLPGVVETAGDGVLHVRCGAALAIVVAAPLPAGTAVWLAVRPEQLVLGPSEALANRAAGRVLQVAYRGETSEIHVALDGWRITLRVSVSNAAVATPCPAVGDRVTVGWPAAAGTVLTQ